MEAVVASRRIHAVLTRAGRTNISELHRFNLAALFFLSASRYLDKSVGFKCALVKLPGNNVARCVWAHIPATQFIRGKHIAEEF